VSKNIVICCDGTGNKFALNSTNVVKLYSVLALDDSKTQVAYYHSGLGTVANPAALTGVTRSWSLVTGLAFGSGILRDLADSYSFLMQNFEEGDRIFLFGFSRGAFTVRALASMLHMVGLLRKDNNALIPQAVEMMKRPDKEAFQLAARFKSTFPRECKPYFVGVWDTVSSVGWIYDPVHIPYSARNTDIRIGRHAISIDERRAFFRQNLWADPEAGQDLKQVWFAGVHSDVGGGYFEEESGLSKITLEWMIREAVKAGLLVQVGRVEKELGKRGDIAALPDPLARLHSSLAGTWILPELLPHRYYDASRNPPRLRWRIPLARRRFIPSGSVLHQTVFERIRGDESYRPTNLPGEYSSEPWVRWGEETISQPLSSAVPSPTEKSSIVQDPPEDLVKDCVEGKCILFAGGGLSAQAGLPTWPQGLGRILDQLATNPQAGDSWRSLRAKLSEGDLDTAAELIASRLSRDELQSLVQDTFAKRKPELSPAHKALSEIPFAFVLTSNWDTLVERTFERRDTLVLSPKDSGQFAVLLREGRFFVLKIYGDANDSRNFLFTAAEHRDSMVENPDYSRFITSLFSSNTVLFVGTSLKGIEDFLSAVRLRGQTGRTHYALVPETPDSVLQDERFQAYYRVKLLFYQADEQHLGVGAFLGGLRQGVRKRRPATTKQVGATPLERVELSNIGPFENFETRFDPEWNVLLANNGLGKSTLLKAIALGLCGDHQNATPAARSLLRVNEAVGRIRLWIGPDIYESELVRDGPNVQVRPRRYTPVQSGTNVVLGFPPLRGVSTRSLTGVSPSDGTEYPVVDDLLPLITNGVDSRVDNLKQWIVNVAVRAQTDPAAARLRDVFFDVLREVSKEVQVTYERVDQSTWQVLMRTPDGIIPVESLSQGMCSVIGWVGALMERMFEIYAKEEHPERMPALVLVDEIDAHMHPAWQQVLVEALSRCFPRVQFIVSTHSPLIVGGLKAAQVKRLGRDLKGKVVELEVREDMMQGRSDQLLTSLLFGLKTSMPFQTQSKILEYQKLLKKHDRSQEENEKLPKLEKEVDALIPTSMSDTVTRLAQDVIDALINEQFTEFPKAREKARDRLEVLLAELSERIRITS
jgi:uncharacterized protein (DUF2235 family)/predicted ATP-binding protein involved in virulence